MLINSYCAETDLFVGGVIKSCEGNTQGAGHADVCNCHCATDKEAV